MAEDKNLMEALKRVDLHATDVYVVLDMIAFRLATALGYTEETHGEDTMNLNSLMAQTEGRLGDWRVLFPQAEPEGL